GVDSDLGRGTTFEIHLPATNVGERPALEPAAPEDDRVEANVLLVEDDTVVRALVRDMLELHGFEVTAVDSPHSAIHVWSADGPFDALVTDLAMPSMTGRELVQRLAERG